MDMSSSRLRKATFLTFILILVHCLSVVSTFATTFASRPFPTVVQSAPIIVRGKIGMVYSNQAEGADGTSRIYTFAELQVEKVFKGSVSGSTLMIRELGGVKDDVGYKVIGSAEFRRGEDVVVMLGAPHADQSYDLKGLMTGKFNVARGEDGKEYLTGGSLSVEATGTGPGAGVAPPTKWTLEALENLIEVQRKNPQVPVESQSDPTAKSDLNRAEKQQPDPKVSPAQMKQDEESLQSPPVGDEGASPNNLVIVFSVLVFGVVIWIWMNRKK